MKDIYWDGLNKNTTDVAKGFITSAYSNYSNEYTDSNGNPQRYYQQVYLTITGVSENNATFCYIPKVSTLVADNSVNTAGFIGIITKNLSSVTINETVFEHYTDPKVPDRTRNFRSVQYMNNAINIGDDVYRINDLIHVNSSSADSVLYYSNGFNSSYWGSNSVKISQKYGGQFTSYKSVVSNNDLRFISSMPIVDTYNKASLKQQITNIINGWGIDIEPMPINLETEWYLFIDGSQNPLYKLTWNCQGINDKDVSNSFIKLWVGKYDSFLGTVTDISLFKKVAYSEGKCKFSFADISKLVKQPTIGHNPACLLMQLGYREFVTARIETSTKMGVDLYFDKSSIQTMYDNLGYFTTENGVIKKTDSGDGSTLTVKDGKDGSDGYTSDDDGGYDDGKDNDDADGETSDISAGIGVLTTTFKMTKERLQQLGQFLWGSSIFDKFSLVNNNPIENIVSCKAIPLSQSGRNQEIVLGNVATGVNGEKISTNFGSQTVGSVTISEYFKNFLDYSPYTNVIIYLPYIGFRELDTSMVMGKSLKVTYTTDCITGGCLAQISVGGVRLYEFTGNMGIDIPITASNRAQVEAGYIQAGVGAAMSLAGGNVVGATTALINSATAQYHYSSTGNPSPMCVASTNRTCYVVIDRPQYQKLNAFNHTRGQKCNLSKTIGNLKGFTICDSHIDLSGISATETEKEEIVNILSTGFFA